LEINFGSVIGVNLSGQSIAGQDVVVLLAGMSSPGASWSTTVPEDYSPWRYRTASTKHRLDIRMSIALVIDRKRLRRRTTSS